MCRGPTACAMPRPFSRARAIPRCHWARGLATEACAALVEIARALGLATLEGSHFLDNPASGRVLEKLGFEPRGLVAPRLSCARGEEVPARLMRLVLKADSGE